MAADSSALAERALTGLLDPTMASASFNGASVYLKNSMAIYTKKGDQGITTLYGHDKKISKSSLEIAILGTIDEVNSHLGLAISFIEEQYLKNKITQVQKTLFRLGSIIAGAKLSIPKSQIPKYEKEIDEWIMLIPKLNSFVLPGGSQAAATIFVARAVARRLERLLVKFSNGKKLKPNILVFVNRLSDYLFTLARYINFRKGIAEVPWRGKRPASPAGGPARQKAAA
jgi:cob(I)alamin adenosyltransferase